MTWTCSICKQTYMCRTSAEHICPMTILPGDQNNDAVTNQVFEIIRQIDAVLAQNERLLRALLETHQ